ncbi:MAG: transcriptional repressor [Oceanicaulis sp.]
MTTAATHPAAEAMKTAERFCRRRNLSLTPVRRRVLELLVEAGGPVKAYDLLAALKPGGAAQPPTVYRALDFLTKAGLAHKVEALNAYTACLHGEEEGGAELFICEGCGAVEERHVHADAEHAPAGFTVARSVIEHYGRCAACG